MLYEEIAICDFLYVLSSMIKKARTMENDTICLPYEALTISNLIIQVKKAIDEMLWEREIALAAIIHYNEMARQF